MGVADKRQAISGMIALPFYDRITIINHSIFYMMANIYDKQVGVSSQINGESIVP